MAQEHLLEPELDINTLGASPDEPPAEPDASQTNNAELIAALQAQISAQQAQLSAKNEQNELFRMMLQDSRPQQPAAKDPWLEEPEVKADPGALLDEFSASGIDALYKHGIPKKADVAKYIQTVLGAERQKIEQMVDQKLGNVAKQAQVYEEFPELRDPEKKEVLGKQARELIAEAEKRGDSGLSWLALQAARGKMAPPQQQFAGPADLRASRVRFQGGGGRGPAEDFTDIPPLDPLTRALNEAAGLSDADYVKSVRKLRGAR